MSLREIPFNSHHVCLWSWPLVIGRSSTQEESSLFPVHNDYAHLIRQTPWPPEEFYVNLLLLEKGLDHALNTVAAEPDFAHAMASFVLILEPEPATRLSDFSSNEAYEQDLRTIADAFRANGVAHIPWNRVSDWLITDLIVNLSHDRSLIQVLRDLSLPGYLFFDPKLERETRLRHLLEGIIHELRYGSLSDEQLAISSRLFSGPWQGTGAELADRLEQDSTYYQFDQERKEASGMAEVTNVLYAREDPGRFNQNNDCFLATGPPEMVPPVDEPESADDMDSLDGWNRGGHSRPKTDFLPFDGEPEPSIESRSKLERSSGDREAAPSPSAPPSTPPQNRTRSHKPETAAPAVDTSRYLLASPTLPGIEPPDPPLAWLAPRTTYDLRVMIGVKKKAWGAGKSAFPEPAVFKPSQKEAEQVKLVYKDNFSAELQEDVLLVRPTGDTGEAWFTFTTKQAGRPYQGIVSAYHRNRLIQELEVRASVADPALLPADLPPVTYTSLNTLAPAEGLKDRQDFHICIKIATDNGPSDMDGIRDDKPITLRYNQALRKKVERIQTLLESTVEKEKSFPPDLLHKNNERLLRQLAVLGHELYTAWKPELGNLKGPIQLVIGPDEFFPLEFLYSWPLPEKKAPVCPKAPQALNEGKCCGNCDLHADESPVVCPFGFAGIREIIERTGGLLPTDVSSAGGQRILTARESVLFASTEKVQEVQAGLIAGMEKAVQKEFGKTWVAKDWKTWKKHVKIAPRSLILVVHTETSVDDQREELEIGIKDLLAKTTFVSSHLRASADAPPPLAFIIGCRTGDPQNHGFDIGSLALRNGAALVFSNFTKILGRQAAPIVTAFVQFLGEHRGKEARFGEIERRLRQHMLAQGIMVSLTLVAHGDADWKLKL